MILNLCIGEENKNQVCAGSLLTTSAVSFGKFWIGGLAYPIRNISLFNKLRQIVAKSIVSTITHLGI